MKPVRRERRNKIEIYSAILNSIIQECKNSDIVRPTRIQFLSNLSYDTLTEFLDHLKKKRMVQGNPAGVHLTKKGKQFLKDYQRIRRFTDKLIFDYL